jgi:hypothetical protein
MKRISKQTKAIADAHIQARLDEKWDTDLNIKTADDVMTALLNGKVIEEVMNQVEVRYCSITAGLTARLMGYASENYRRDVYRGFKYLLDK